MAIFRRLLLLGMALGPVALASAQLSVSLLPDAAAVAGGAALAAISQRMPASTAEMPVDLTDVNGFDRLIVLPYSRAADIASDVTLYGGMALPLILALVIPQDQSLAAGVIYLEVLSEAMFAKNAGKYLFPRVRPWLYRAADSGSVPGVWEGNDSFPSGHSTLAFAAAGFGVTVALLELPSTSPWRAPLIAASAGLAVATASLRVAAGMHFLTDVMAGAALGGIIGVALPLAHSAFAGPVLGTTTAVPRIALQLVKVAY